MSALAVEDLHVWFDLPGGRELHAVQGIDLALEPGERLGLVGESGCGKTTAILAMMGLLPPSASVAGRVLLDGIIVGGSLFLVSWSVSMSDVYRTGAATTPAVSSPDRSGMGRRVEPLGETR